MSTESCIRKPVEYGSLVGSKFTTANNLAVEEVVNLKEEICKEGAVRNASLTEASENRLIDEKNLGQVKEKVRNEKSIDKSFCLY